MNQFAQDRLNPSLLKVLLVVCRRYSAGEPATFRDIMQTLGWQSPNYVRECLEELRARKLVSDYRGKKRAIIPNCTVEILRKEGARAES